MLLISRHYNKLLIVFQLINPRSPLISNKKPPAVSAEGSMGSLAVSYFRTVYLALSSALRRFTVLFGMGRSGTTSLLLPGKA